MATDIKTQTTRRIMCEVISELLKKPANYDVNTYQVRAGDEIILQFDSDDIDRQFDQFEEWCKERHIEPF